MPGLANPALNRLPAVSHRQQGLSRRIDRSAKSSRRERRWRRRMGTSIGVGPGHAKPSRARKETIINRMIAARIKQRHQHRPEGRPAWPAAAASMIAEMAVSGNDDKGADDDSSTARQQLAYLGIGSTPPNEICKSSSPENLAIRNDACGSADAPVTQYRHHRICRVILPAEGAKLK